MSNATTTKAIRKGYQTTGTLGREAISQEAVRTLREARAQAACLRSHGLLARIEAFDARKSGPVVWRTVEATK